MAMIVRSRTSDKCKMLVHEDEVHKALNVLMAIRIICTSFVKKKKSLMKQKKIFSLVFFEKDDPHPQIS